MGWDVGLHLSDQSWGSFSVDSSHVFFFKHLFYFYFLIFFIKM